MSGAQRTGDCRPQSTNGEYARRYVGYRLGPESRVRRRKRLQNFSQPEKIESLAPQRRAGGRTLLTLSSWPQQQLSDSGK